MRDCLSGIFNFTDPTGTVTFDSPAWVSGWNVPLLKLTKPVIHAHRDDTHDLHHLVDELFAQLQEKMSSGESGPAAFKIPSKTSRIVLIARYVKLALRYYRNLALRMGCPFQHTNVLSGLWSLVPQGVPLHRL